MTKNRDGSYEFVQPHQIQSSDKGSYVESKSFNEIITCYLTQTIQLT